MEPIIKVEPEDETRRPDNLLSRNVLTRGFGSFEGPSSMIDDNDLLNIGNLRSPEFEAQDGSDLTHLNDFSHVNSMVGTSGGARIGNNNNQSATAASSIGFGLTGPGNRLDNTGSPYENFLLDAGKSPIQSSSVGGGGGGGSASASTSKPITVGSVPSNSYTQRLLNDKYGSSYLSTPMGGSSIDSVLSLGELPGSGKLGPSSLGAAPRNMESKQHLMAEKKRRRRESHNAVERRRRDNINEKIKELSELLPEQYLTAAAESSSKGNAKDDNRPHKGTILALSVEYIRKLQLVIDEQNHKELEHQQTINDLETRLGITPTEFTYTTAEKALSRLGLRPIEESPFEEEQLDEQDPSQAPSQKSSSISAKPTPDTSQQGYDDPSTSEFIADYGNTNNGFSYDNNAYINDFDQPFLQD